MTAGLGITGTVAELAGDVADALGGAVAPGGDETRGTLAGVATVDDLSLGTGVDEETAPVRMLEEVLGVAGAAEESETKELGTEADTVAVASVGSQTTAR